MVYEVAEVEEQEGLVVRAMSTLDFNLNIETDTDTPTTLHMLHTILFFLLNKLHCLYCSLLINDNLA